jgi:hypothetical protein
MANQAKGQAVLSISHNFIGSPVMNYREVRLIFSITGQHEVHKNITALIPVLNGRFIFWTGHKT